jgi:hypothetical protein
MKDRGYSSGSLASANLSGGLELLNGAGGPTCTILPQAKFFVDLAA